MAIDVETRGDGYGYVYEGTTRRKGFSVGVSQPDITDLWSARGWRDLTKDGEALAVEYLEKTYGFPVNH